MDILLADPHPIVVHGLGQVLKVAGMRVKAVSCADALLGAVERSRADVLIVEPEMPGQLRSVNLIEAVLKRRPTIRMVAYSSGCQPCLVEAVIEAGAQACVAKTSSPARVIDAVRVLGSGGRFVDPAIDLELARSHPWRHLTPSEREVVLRLARSEPLPTIAAETGRSYKTLSAHKYNALEKLHLRSACDLARYVEHIGLGYLLDENRP